MLLTTDRRYLDFGDGNYLYISWRFLEGVTLYRDILTPQPPVLFIIGATLLKVGDSWKVVRLFNILLGIATAFLVYKVSVDLFDNRKIALIAGATYYMLPIHLLWGRGFEADSLVTLFSLLSFMFFKAFNPKGMVLASLFTVLAIYTKYSFLPVLVFNLLYLWLRERRMFKFYSAPIAVLGIATLVSLNIYSSGLFIWDTLIFQSKAPGYPFDIPIDIALSGLSFIFSGEGAFIFLSLIGLLSLANRKKSRADYFAGNLLSSFVPLGLIFRQGTGTYIFYSAEPYIAIFSAYFIYELVVVYGQRSMLAVNHLNILRSKFFLRLFLIGLSTSSLYLMPCIDLCFKQGIDFQRFRNWSNAEQVEVIVDYIENYTSKNDAILSPPYFAFLTQRKLLFDYSETWLWLVLYENGESCAMELVKAITSRLESSSVKLVILDLRMKTIEPIYKAILQNYILVRRVLAYDMLEVYIPKSVHIKPFQSTYEPISERTISLVWQLQSPGIGAANQKSLGDLNEDSSSSFL